MVHKFLQMGFCLLRFELLLKIFIIKDIVQIETSGEERINIDIVVPYKILKSLADPLLLNDDLVIVEMIDYLIM